MTILEKSARTYKADYRGTFTQLKFSIKILDGADNWRNYKVIQN